MFPSSTSLSTASNNASIVNAETTIFVRRSSVVASIVKRRCKQSHVESGVWRRLAVLNFSVMFLSGRKNWEEV